MSEAAAMPLGVGQLKVEVENDETDFPIISASGNGLLSASNNEIIAYGSGLDRYGYYRAGDHMDMAPKPFLVHFSRYICYTNGSGMKINGHNPKQPEDNWMEAYASRNTGSGSCFNRVAVRMNFTLLSSQKKFMMSGFILFSNFDLPLSIPVSWYPDMPGEQTDGSHVFDLLDPADKNWNVRIDNPSSTTWLTLSPSTASSGDLGNSGVSALSSKYASHAYLHVAKGPYKVGTIQKSSARGG